MITGELDQAVSSENRKPPHSGRRLSAIGFMVTFLWLACLATYSALNWSRIAGLAPNEVGDTLAGAFAPLAFFWLVLGFMQQGDELRNSSRALWLQGEELRNSVEQQRQLVEVTREQLAFESDRLSADEERLRRLAQPTLDLVLSSFSAGQDGSRRQNVDLVNHGRPCTKIEVRVVSTGKRRSWDHLGTGRREQFSIVLDSAFVRDEIAVSYLDERGEPGAATFELTQPEEGNFLFTRFAA